MTLNSTLVDNGNFEDPDVSQSSGGYEYQPGNATWSFTGHTGIANNGSELTLNNPGAPDGKQAAFIQGSGRIYQTRSVSAGTYTLSFQAAQGGNNTGEQQVRVTLRPSGAASQVKTFVWCGTQICEERDGTGATVTKRFFAEGEQRLGGHDAGNYYYSRDHLGSIREVTDAAGELQARYDYDAYGNSVVVEGKMNVDFGYTGHYFHAPSGLNLTLYRAYDPLLGRWLSRDPIGEAGGVNLYGYVGNDPINWTDPSGLFERDVHEGALGQTYGTYTWARDLGIPDQVAKAIGKANIGTDSGITGPWPGLSLTDFGRARHFDIPLGGDDSRDAWAWTEMNIALRMWETDKCGAYEALGRGLHSIQDKFAHGSYDNASNPIRGWIPHPRDWDNWAGRPELHEPVERATKAYLQYFLNKIQ